MFIPVFNLTLSTAIPTVRAAGTYKLTLLTAAALAHGRARLLLATTLLLQVFCSFL